MYAIMDCDSCFIHFVIIHFLNYLCWCSSVFDLATGSLCKLASVAGVFIKDTPRNVTEEEKPQEDSHGRSAARSKGMPIAPELGERGKKGFYPGASDTLQTALQTPWFQTSAFQIWQNRFLLFEVTIFVVIGYCVLPLLPHLLCQCPSFSAPGLNPQCGPPPPSQCMPSSPHSTHPLCECPSHTVAR